MARKNPGKNIENLVPFDERTESEQREIARKGGIKSGETRRKKREFKEIAEHLLSMTVKNGDVAEIEEMLSIADIRGKNITVADAITIAIAQNAMKGDIQSANFMVAITGQKPKEEAEMQVIVNEGKLGSILKQLEEDKKR